jgi:hypothetical protein
LETVTRYIQNQESPARVAQPHNASLPR